MTSVAEPQSHSLIVGPQNASAPPSANPQDKSKPFEFFGRATYASHADACMVRDTLAVDPELRPEQVTRGLSVEGNDFVMKFNAADVRTLRAAVSTFCDLLALVTRTLEMSSTGLPSPVSSRIARM
ncbi:hypothetical protein WJX77_008186 [Trebouxia sp. C0004]